MSLMLCNERYLTYKQEFHIFILNSLCPYFPKHPEMSQIVPKHPKTSKKSPTNSQNIPKCPKTSQIVPKCPKISQNFPKCLKDAHIQFMNLSKLTNFQHIHDVAIGTFP